MRILVTGGLGLVGSNYAAHCLMKGDHVVVLDSYARGTSSHLNERWLKTLAAEVDGSLEIMRGHVEWDLDLDRLWGDGFDRILHAAAQSSVNLSMAEPGIDFASNVIGTFQVLEMARQRSPKARIIFMGSNKVYDVTDWPTELVGTQHRWVGRRVGPSEARPFYTDAKEPYGASKITGFYYSRCYAAMYDMPIIITVPSGMYGPRQFGKEEQGWLGWFAIATLLGLPLTFYGDGFQVRDMCHVDDICRAFDLLFEHAVQYKGEVFNLGGGPRNAISLIEALSTISAEMGLAPAHVEYAGWRLHDNKVYVSNLEKIVGLGWAPVTSIQDGIRDMAQWVRSEQRVLTLLYKETQDATRFSVSQDRESGTGGV